MLGFTIEKLIIIAMLIGFLFGPEQLVRLSRQLGSWMRAARHWTEQAQQRARTEFGSDVERWTEFDPQRHHPRRIIRDTLADEDCTLGPSETTVEPIAELTRQYR